MNVRPFIPKDYEELPDAYQMTINYIDGKQEVFEIASHRLGDKMLEFVTHQNDVWNWVQMANVKRIEFDKRFSKMIAIKEKVHG